MARSQMSSLGNRTEGPLHCMGCRRDTYGEEDLHIHVVNRPVGSWCEVRRLAQPPSVYQRIGGLTWLVACHVQPSLSCCVCVRIVNGMGHVVLNGQCWTNFSLQGCGTHRTRG